MLVRQSSVSTKRGGAGGTTSPVPNTALETGAPNGSLAWPECLCSEKAQRASAWS
jgi:hypothetical protein